MHGAGTVRHRSLRFPVIEVEVIYPVPEHLPQAESLPHRPFQRSHRATEVDDHIDAVELLRDRYALIEDRQVVAVGDGIDNRLLELGKLIRAGKTEVEDLSDGRA